MKNEIDNFSGYTKPKRVNKKRVKQNVFRGLESKIFPIETKTLGKKNSILTLISNLSIYYRWINVKKLYKNNKLKISVSTCKNKFELLDG